MCQYMTNAHAAQYQKYNTRYFSQHNTHTVFCYVTRYGLHTSQQDSMHCSVCFAMHVQACGRSATVTIAYATNKKGGKVARLQRAQHTRLQPDHTTLLPQHNHSYTLPGHAKKTGPSQNT